MDNKNTFFEDYQNLINSFEALKKEASNPFFKSKYVTLNQILPVVKAKCTENNFILNQFPEVREGKNVLVTNIEHISERVLNGSIEIVSKDPTDPQKVGAGITYMRRYSLVTMFMLEDEDDDGNTASNQSAPAQTNTAQPAPNKTYTPTPEQEQEDDNKPWITDEIFQQAIYKLLEAGTITKETPEGEVLKVLRTKYKVAKKYGDLVLLALK